MLRRTTLPVREEHGIDDQGNQNQPNRESCETEAAPELDVARCWWRHQHVIQLSAFGQLLVFTRSVAAEFIERHTFREDYCVNRELFGTEVGIEEMHDKDEAYGQ